MPQAADQFRDTVARIRRGVALALSPDAASGEAIDSAVKRLLEETSLLSAAKEVAAEIAAMPSPADVVRVLSDLAT